MSLPSASASVSTAANDNDDVLDVVGAAAFLHVGKDAIYAGCARQDIPHRRVGKHLRFSRAALMRWLDSRADRQEQKGP